MAFASLVVAAASREVQETVWADGPDVILASTAAGLRATRVPGGFRLSGKGPFTSGSSNATWFYLGAMMFEDGKPVDGRFFILPRRDVTVEQSWNTMAMRGTGSNTVILDDVFVPEPFGVPFAQLREGSAPGAALNAHSLYHLPWVCVVPLIYTATMLGATQAAYAALLDGLRAKRGPGGRRVADSEDLQIQVSLLSAQIDAAETVLRAAADRADSGVPQTLEDRARMTRNGSFVAQSLAEAIGQVLELSGTGGFGESSIIQQAWRDVNLAAAHQSLSKRLAAARYGRLQLEVEDTSLAPFF